MTIFKRAVARNVSKESNDGRCQLPLWYTAIFDVAAYGQFQL
jgi:hypothetical protein